MFRQLNVKAPSLSACSEKLQHSHSFLEPERMSVLVCLQMEREQSEFCNLKASQYTELASNFPKDRERNIDKYEFLNKQRSL